MPGKAEFVDKIAELTGMPKTKVALCFDYVFDLTAKALASGDKVTVPNFGTFQVAARPTRQGRNPATGQTITIPASKTVRFKPSKNLKDQL